MKTLIFFFSFTFVISIFFGCENASDNDCHIRSSYIFDIVIADTILKDEEIEIPIIYGKPNPCYILQDVIIMATDSSLSFDVNICYKVSKGLACQQVPVIDTTYKCLSFSHIGTINLFIRDTIFVKKIEVI